MTSHSLRRVIALGALAVMLAVVAWVVIAPSAGAGGKHCHRQPCTPPTQPTTTTTVAVTTTTTEQPPPTTVPEPTTTSTVPETTTTTVQVTTTTPETTTTLAHECVTPEGHGYSYNDPTDGDCGVAPPAPEPPVEVGQPTPAVPELPDTGAGQVIGLALLGTVLVTAGYFLIRTNPKEQ